MFNLSPPQLDKILSTKGVAIGKVINLDIDDKVLVRRVLGRYDSFAFLPFLVSCVHSSSLPSPLPDPPTRTGGSIIVQGKPFVCSQVDDGRVIEEHGGREEVVFVAVASLRFLDGNIG